MVLLVDLVKAILNSRYMDNQELLSRSCSYIGYARLVLVGDTSCGHIGSDESGETTSVVEEPGGRVTGVGGHASESRQSDADWTGVDGGDSTTVSSSK